MKRISEHRHDCRTLIGIRTRCTSEISLDFDWLVHHKIARSNCEKRLDMATNWLVCVDDSVWASYAFNFCLTYLNKETDRMFLVCFDSSVINFST
jgi:hypothetical protein